MSPLKVNYGTNVDMDCFGTTHQGNYLAGPLNVNTPTRPQATSICIRCYIEYYSINNTLKR
jgi:hypothetical protein